MTPPPEIDERSSSRRSLRGSSGLLRRALTRISVRLLAFNLLLIFLPAAGIFTLDVFEEQLRAAQERSMVQQGRILAAALSNRSAVVDDSVETAEVDEPYEVIDIEAARRLLENLDQRTTARLRVLDRDGKLLADSSRLGPRGESTDEDDGEPEIQDSLLYRIGSAPFRAWDLLRGRSPSSTRGYDVYDPDAPFDGVEVREALAGRYGAAFRLSPGQRSVTLYSALPITDSRPDGRKVVGAVLVSQSTLRLLRDLYDVRLTIFRVFLLSVVAAIVLSLLVSTTIARPIRRLQREAVDLLDRRGRLTGRFGGSTRRDEIGDLARALAELSTRLEQRVRFIEGFAADVSHEFKNPLASIRTAVEVLADDSSDRQLSAEERDRFLRRVQGEVSRLERLLSGVQEITHLDATIDAEERQLVDLDDLLEQLEQGLSLRLERLDRGVVLSLKPSNAKPPLAVSAAPDRLVQVFENLINNAVSFSPDDSTIEVVVEHVNESQNDRARITVADHGPGVPPESLDKLFERFYSDRPVQESAAPDPADRPNQRSNERPSERHSGLGLAIVQAIVEGYGGRVEASNRPANEGTGAIFTVELPLAQI